MKKLVIAGGVLAMALGAVAAEAAVLVVRSSGPSSRRAWRTHSRRLPSSFPCTLPTAAAGWAAWSARSG